jgi:hypothetical protein
MEWAEGTRLGWFLGGLFVVAFVATCYFIYTKIRAKREKGGLK